MKIRVENVVGSVLVIASIAGVSQLLWPPIGAYVDQNGHSLIDIIVTLLNPVSTDIYAIPFMGWLFIISCLIIGIGVLAAARLFFRYLEKSKVPISVLETNVTIDVLDPAGIEVVYRRHQTFHANQKKLKAYRLTMSADADGGSIDRETLQQNSTLDDVDITEDIILRGSDKALTVMERFDRELPTSRIATYLPNAAVLWMYRHELFQKTVIKRTGSVVYRNECSRRHCVMAVNASVSPITSVQMTVIFPEEAVPKNIRCYVTHANVCDDVHLTPITSSKSLDIPEGKVGFRAKKRGLYHRNMEILWENENCPELE